MRKTDKEIEEEVVADLEEVLPMIEDAVDIISYPFNTTASDFLDTDDGHITVRLDEIVWDIKAKISSWKKKNKK